MDLDLDFDFDFDFLFSGWDREKGFHGRVSGRGCPGLSSGIKEPDPWRCRPGVDVFSDVLFCIADAVPDSDRLLLEESCRFSLHRVHRFVPLSKTPDVDVARIRQLSLM